MENGNGLRLDRDDELYAEPAPVLQQKRKAHRERKYFYFSGTGRFIRISLSDAPLTPHELCSCMGLGKSAVSRVIEHLEKKELLIKKPNLADKRSYLLSITEEGQKALEETYEYYLSPIYTMRRKLGEAHFMELMKLIHETNDVLQDRKH